MRYFILLLLTTVSAFSAPSPLAADRRVPWIPGSTVGVSNGIPTTFTFWTNAVDAGADPTGVANSRDVFDTLIDTAGTWGRVVNVSTGRFEVGTQIGKNANIGGIIFRGAGSNIGTNTPQAFASLGTTFICTNGFLIHDSQTYFDFTVDENITIGQTNFNVRPGNDLTPYVGKTARISVANSPNTDPHNVKVLNVNAYENRDMYQFVQIVAVNGSAVSNVTIWPPAGRVFTNTASVRFGVNTSPICEFIGFENIRFIGSNDITGCPAASANFISMFGARNWWFKNCRIENPNGFFISILGGLFNEIGSCDFVSSVAGANTAVVITSGESGLYMYNNFSIGGSPLIEGNGLSASAVIYNYATNAVSNDYHVGNPFDNHAPHSWGNIFEGNYGSMYQSDSYFGSSSELTFHRNYFSGYDVIKVGIPRCLDLGRFTQRANILGNILGAPAGVSNFYMGTWTLFPTPVYMVTNQFFSDAVPQIYRIGYPFPGNSSYGSNVAALSTPQTDWRYPGPQYKYVVSNGTTGPDGTNVLYGDFSLFTSGYISAAGGIIYFLVQNGSDTNKYYSQCNATTAGSGTSITINSFINYTNGDHVYRVGADSYVSLTHSQTNDYLFHGNYDTTNAAVVNSADLFVTNSYVLPNGGARPDAWWVNELGVVMSSFPPVTNTLGVASINPSNWPATRRFYYASAQAQQATNFNPGKGKRTGPRGPQRR